MEIHADRDAVSVSVVRSDTVEHPRRVHHKLALGRKAAIGPAILARDRGRVDAEKLVLEHQRSLGGLGVFGELGDFEDVGRGPVEIQARVMMAGIVGTARRVDVRPGAHAPAFRRGVAGALPPVRRRVRRHRRSPAHEVLDRWFAPAREIVPGAPAADIADDKPFAPPPPLLDRRDELFAPVGGLRPLEHQNGRREQVDLADGTLRPCRRFELRRFQCSLPPIS